MSDSEINNTVASPPQPQINSDDAVAVATSPESNNYRRSRSPLRELNVGNRRRTASQPQMEIDGARAPAAGFSLRSAQSQPHLAHNDDDSVSQSGSQMSYTNLRYEFMSGKRINSKLLHTMDEHGLYVFRIGNKKLRQYDCYKSSQLGCTAKVFIDNATSVCFRKETHPDKHNHGALNDEIHAIKLKTHIKTKCGDAAALAEQIGGKGTGNVRGIFQHCLVNFNNDDEDEHNADDGNGNDIPRNVPNFFAMRRHLQRIRNKVLPSSPCTPLEIQQNFLLPDIMKEYGNAIAIGNDEPIPFYRCVSIEQEFAYCIFASQRIIDEIAKLPEERRHYYMDGTFKVVPFGDFNQLLIIYAEFFQKTIPFIFVLMTRKLEKSYEHLFRYIDAHILELKPTSFMTDFERAMRNALRTVWPAAEQFTCWFHYCQAIKRHASQIPEFLSIARSEAKTIRIYYDVMCLPLLPAASIKIAFEELKMEAAAKHGTLYTKFMRYVESQWIKKEGPENISVHGRHSRTTSSLEAYNCSLNKRIRAKGNFYGFAQVLIREEFEKYTTLQLLLESAGGVVETVKRGDREEVIARATKELAQKLLTPRQFLTRVAFKTKMSYLNDLKIISLHADDDKIKLEDFENSDNDNDEGAVGGTPQSKAPSCCTICLCAAPTVLFTKCRHMVVCTPCYTELIRPSKTAHTTMVRQWYIDHENDLLDENETEPPPPLQVKCVYCRLIQTENEVITGIFTS